MKKLMMLFVAAALTFGMSSVASAQTSDATGTLQVSATVTGSLTLVFTKDTNGVALTSGSGTNTAALSFGNISAFGSPAAGVTTSTTASNFTVSTPVDVTVNKFNSASANYTLKAQLNGAPGTETWAVNGASFDNSTIGTATATGTYGSPVAVTLAITVPFTTASGTSISNTINFTASAN